MKCLLALETQISSYFTCQYKAILRLPLSTCRFQSLTLWSFHSPPLISNSFVLFGPLLFLDLFFLPLNNWNNCLFHFCQAFSITPSHQFSRTTCPRKPFKYDFCPFCWPLIVLLTICAHSQDCTLIKHIHGSHWKLIFPS